MVKSRKYAIVTAALALILVAAVVLTVVLVGNGSFYTPEQDGIASNAAVTVNSTTGTVPNRTQYIFETLTENSAIGSRGNGWQVSDRNEEGIFVTTLNSKFYLLSNYTWNELIENKIPGVGNGYYEMIYNGATYRFMNGNSGLSGDLSSLYRTFTMFMTNASFYQDTAVYGLIFTESVSYNPNDTYYRSWFDATLDGAGATVRPSAALNITDDYNRWPHESGGNRPYVSGVDYIKNGYLTSYENQMNRNANGTAFAGLLFGAIRNGTLMNFQWNDAGVGGHSYTLRTEQYGTAFGGLVGLAANDTSTQSTSIKSSVYNVSMSFNNNITHAMHLRNLDSANNSQCDIISGGLIGINLNADIELVSINYNSSTFQQVAARQKWISFGSINLEWGTSSFGGVVGAQSVKNGMTFTFSKVTITGTAQAALAGNDDWNMGTNAGWNQGVSNVFTQQGAIFGSVSGNLTLDGIIIDMNYDNIYTEWYDKEADANRDSTPIQRGVLAGHIYNSTLSYRNIYITDKASTNMQTMLNNIGTNNEVSVSSSKFGTYTAYYSYIGAKGKDNYTRDSSRAFIYANENVISSINFAYVDPDETFADGEIEPVVEISRPAGASGVMWDIEFYEHGNTTNKALQSYDLFTQNAYSAVQVGTVTSYPASQYLEMRITYASSYDYVVSNGPNNNGTGDKVYDGTMVNYPTLDVNDNQVISSYDSDLLTSNGYLTLNASGSTITLVMNNGTQNIGNFGITNFYDANGTATGGNNMDNIVASVLQLENNTDGGYVKQNKAQWATMVNANTYRWSSIGLFAVETTNSDRKYVFSPAQSSSAELKIDQRPIYLDVVNDSVPYIGQGYRLEQGGDGSTFGVVNYTFGTTADGNAIIGSDQVTVQAALSGDTASAVNAGTYSLSANNITGASANNYRLDRAPGSENSFTITPADVTLNITGGSMTYGTALESRTDFMNLVQYTLDFADETGLSAFASRDNITLNLNLQTGESATTAGALLFDPVQGSSVSGQRFAFNFPAGEYEVLFENISGSGAGNYNVTLAEGSQPFNINKAALHFDLSEIADFTYGDMALPSTSYSSGGLIGNDTIENSTVNYFTQGGSAYTTTPFGAGNYYAEGKVTQIISRGSVNGLNNYDITYNRQSFEVFKRDTTVQFDFDPSATYSYKGEEYNFTAVKLGNPAFGDTAEGVTFQAYSDVNRETAVEALNAGMYYAGAVSDTLRANYNVTGITDMNGAAWENFVIGRATVTLSNTGITNATYSGDPISYDPSLITINYGGVPGLADEIDTLKKALTYAYNGSSSAPVNAGTYNVTVSLPLQQNFNAASLTISGGLKIGQLAITIEPDGGATVTVIYNGVMIPDLTYTVTANGEPIEEQLEITTEYYKDSVEAGNITSDLRNVGTYIIVYSYDGTTGNYADATAQVTYTVTRKSLTLTLNNANVTYNKEAFSPDYTVEGLITGDNAEITYTVQKDSAAHDGDVINAGTYEFTFSAGNGNYIISEESAKQTVVIAPYDLTAQALNTTVFFNSGDRTPGYYENQLKVRVLDADGTDITNILSGSITKDLIVSTGDDTSVTEVGERGGNYAVKVTIASLPEGYDASNYTLQPSIYAVFVYRIALGGKLTGGTDADSVTYGTGFDIKGVLTAMAGDKTQELTVNSDGNVDGIKGSDLTDVTSITISSATFAVNGVTLALTDNTVTIDDIGADINTIFNLGVYDKGFANAGTYTATITIELDVAYQDSGHDRTVEISAPFTWTVDPYKIQVTAGQLNKYYTEAITTSDVLEVVEVDDQYKGYITAVSSVIGGTSSTFVNAGNYTYDVVLNTGAAGYYNYTLPDVSTGDIVVSPLRLVVTVGDLTGDRSVQYGDAIAPTATAQLFKGEAVFETEDTRVTSQYSWTTSSSVPAGTGVGNYEDALTATVTETDNFEVETVAGNLEITKRMLGIALNNVTMAYSTGEIDVTYRITSGSLYGNDEQPVLVNYDITVGGKVADLDRLAVGGYDLNVQGAAFDNPNYGIADSVTNGTLTVTPYEIISVTWNAPGQLVYKGAAFENGELYTVENFENGNGDVVTFSVSYGGEVMNAGSYSARVAVASVTNGAVPVDAGNYSVANVAAQSFSVAKANLAVSEVGGVAAVDGAVTYTTTYNNSEKTISPDDIIFTFGNNLTYEEGRDGTLNVSVAYRQNGTTASTVNAGTYNVIITVSGDNFANANLTNVTMVIERWELTQKELATVADIDIPDGAVYDSQPHGASITFYGIFAGLNLSYTFTYTKDGETVDPVDAGSYIVTLVIDTANVYYSTADGTNEGTIVIAPTNRFTITASVPSSAGLDANEVYYTGAPIIPNAQADITVAGDVTQLIITDSAAFSFLFYEQLSPDDNGVDLSTLGYDGLPSGTYYVNPTPSDTAVSSGYYYVFVTFNEGSAYSGNYASGSIWITDPDGTLTSMQIVKGNMSVRVNNVSSDYSGLVGYNGRDVIYQTEDGKWMINTDLITFTGVDLAGMTDLTTDLKTGDIVITVSYVYGTDDTTGEQLATALYNYTWEYDSASNVRSTPVKAFLPEERDDSGRQVSGPYIGVDGFEVYDFGYSGYNITTRQHAAAVYRIDISVDNTQPGSEYSPARQIATDEDGQPIIVDGVAQTVEVPHTAEGSATVNPATVDFDMLYTNSFYNDGNDVLEGNYAELNTVGGDESLADYILRGIAIPEDGHLLTTGYESAGSVTNVTLTGYRVDLNNAKYGYEVLATSAITITVTDSDGTTVYTYANGVSGGTGIINAGTYTFEFEFAGMPGKYEPFTYTGTFVQQKAEYHITVTQKEGANLTTEFGVEFDVSDIAKQLEVKVELGDGDYTTATGKYTAFENAVAQSGGDMSTLDSYIKLVGADDGGGISTEYNTNNYKSNVGSYFIYYVYTSVDSNLEIVMETESSMIEVTKTAPSFMVNAEGERVDEKEGLDLGSRSYTPNTSWNNDIIKSVGLGIEYKSLEGLTGEYYTTNKVAIATIEYSADGDVWTKVEVISSVGKYRVTIAAAGEGAENAEANLEGALNGVYVFFEVTRISAQANVVVTGSDLVWSDEAGAYIATFNGNTHAIGYSVTAGGNAVSDSSLQGTVNILIAFTENAADGDYVDINTSPIVGAGSYWVKVTVTGSENYDVTPSEAVKITINKADPTIRFEQSEYNMTYSLKGNTIPAGDYSFELDGRIAPDITAENSSVYYLSAPISGSGDVAGAQSQVAAMVNAFIASGAESIAEWLEQNKGAYPDYKFTSLDDGTPAATDVGYYFPVVIFNGDDNYNHSGALVANVPHPVITVAKATLVLAVTIVDDMYVVYGSAPGEDIDDASVIGNYVSMDWSYTDADGGVVTVDSGIFGQIVSGFEYRLINCNQYVQGTAVGTVPNAYLFVVDSFESTNFGYTYDQGGYVNIQVTPATVAFDVSQGSVSLINDIDDQGKQQTLTQEGYTFNRVYSGTSFGPLAFAYAGNTGLDVNGDNSKETDDAGFGKHGIFTVSASGGYTQEAVSAAGSYTGSITITLNNTNYVVEGMEEGTLTLPVNLVIDKAIIQISFDYLTYAVGDKTYTETSSAGTGEHLGWYEYATIYTGANFDYNNRVYVTSYCYKDGELVPYGAYSGGKRLGEVGGITEKDGASDNLAAPGEYNIHLMLDQLATNYKFIDSAGNTLGQAADGSQADLSSLDINVTVSPSTFVKTGNSLAADVKPLFDYADGVYSREFDGTDLTAAFLKTFLSVVPYKLSNNAGTLQGSIAGSGNPVPLVSDRDYASELIGNNLIVELLSDGAAVDSAKYVGDYTLRVRLNNNAYSMDDMQFTLKITPASKIDASVSVKGQTARTYNGLDIVPNITLTLTVTDYNGNGHTIGVPSYTANVYKQVEGKTPDAPTFSYGVVNGDVNTAEINGKFTDAGTYIVRLVINNPNVKVTELSGHDQTYTINARPLTDGSIRSTYEKLFSYRTTVNSGGEVVPVAVSAEDLKVLITYNRTTNLVLGEDFTIEFAGGAGQYTGNYAFTITGKGNFTGVIEGSYSIGASVGIVSAPDAITYGDDSVTVRLNINSLGSNSLAGDLTLNFFTGASSRVVDANGNTVAQLGVPSEIVILADDVSGNEFEVVFTGLGAVNAGEYFLDLVFSCTYAGITTEGTISREVSGETASKVVVDEADVAAAATGVTATVTAVNSTTVSFNISGLPSAYEYSVDGGETWIKANKGSNTISGLTAGTAFKVLLRINDVNYASSENVHEYPLASALSFTTTASVDDIIASAESLANNFNATGFARYAQLLQNVASVSSGDLAARGDEIEEALAAVEEARAEYIEDLQAAIDSAVGAAEKAAGKASGVSGAATAGLVAGGVAMPVLGIGLIFAAARKRKSKEEDLND